MTYPLSWIGLETARELGWTLIHFLWQGLLLAALLNAILPLCRSAITRHNCALATLIAMVLAPIATFLLLHDFGNDGAAAFAAPLPPAIPLSWMNVLVMLWLGGVAALSLRALAGWHLVRALEGRDSLPVSADLLRRCHAMQRRLGVAGVRFLLSPRIDVPMVIGCLRPLILIPLSAVAGLPPSQLDGLILHELAHIRRLDTLTNIVLVTAETVLFYHPAVWWVSRQARIEREYACDDVAVSGCGDAGLYVEALTSLAASRAAPALAANGGRLKNRVARLLGAPTQSRSFSLSAAGLALVSLLVASIAIAAPHGKIASRTELRPIRETHTLPPYPKESLHLKEQGVVLLGVTVGKDGTVSRAVVVKPSGHQRLDDAAAEYVQSHWRWQPATRGGKPVVASTRVSVLFKLAPKTEAPATR